MGNMVIEPLGETALLIQFGEKIDEGVNRQVQAAVSLLEASPFPGFVECIPSFAAVAVYYDPFRLDRSPGEGTAFEHVRSLVQNRLKQIGVHAERKRDVIDIPVCYGGEHGPDLAYVAELNGLNEAEVVSIHSGRDYLVYALGFAPGFPYLGGMLSKHIRTAERNAPVVHSCRVGRDRRNPDLSIYPLDTPGGWQIIGRTPLALFRPGQDPPVLLNSGQYIRFRPIGVSEYDRLAGERG